MKNILIIGASSGIGKRLAEILSEQGVNVFGTYNHHPTEGFKNVQFHHLDVLEESVNLDILPDSLDGLVYCPGRIDLKPFARIKPGAFQADFDLQVLGAIKVIQACLPRLKATKGASIVLFSTVAVQSGFPFHTQVSVSKGAIEGLTRALSAELAPGIRVNCIAPSLTDTPLAARLLNSPEKKEANANRHPLKSIGSPDDIAEMAAFLLSDKAKWITAQVMHVDGGMSIVKN